LPAERAHRGRIAVALDAAAAWHVGAVARRQAVRVLRPEAARFHEWLEAQMAGRSVWFIYDGASLHSLVGVRVDGDGLLVVDVERVVG
jgi:hypothetical protein